MKKVAMVFFHPLLWIREIVVGVSRLVFGLFMLGLVLGVFMGAARGFDLTAVRYIMAFGAYGLVSFLVYWLYDDMLLWLNPTEQVLLLQQ